MPELGTVTYKQCSSARRDVCNSNMAFCDISTVDLELQAGLDVFGIRAVGL